MAPPARKTNYRFTRRIMKGLDNASVVNLLIECIRDYHSKDKLIPIEKRPTEEDITETVREILFRMEKGHSEDPMQEG